MTAEVNTEKLSIKIEGINNSVRSNISDRLSPELIFAFVEPFSCGAEEVVDKFDFILKSAEFNYETNIISISDLIHNLELEGKIPGRELHPRLSKLKDVSSEAKRINLLQASGNELRRIYGSDILIKYAIQEISKKRNLSKGLGSDNKSPVPLRHVHLIRSLKNIQEYFLLKEIYGNILFLIAVSALHEDRISKYQNKNIGINKLQLAEEYNILSEIDQDEGLAYGQQVKKIFHQADLFLDTSASEAVLGGEIKRFLNILFGKHIYNPSIDEVMMHEAYTASLRSGCLSRQVGAAIATDSGELLSTGWNDVPAFDGGLAADYREKSHPSMCKNIRSCNSDPHLKQLLLKILYNLQSEGQPIQNNFINICESDPKPVLKKLGLSDLIEFSRAVHAEMEAILAAARYGRAGIVGSTMYVTTFPCENCMKHIIAAGIHKIVYIEPYPKSRAYDFFDKLICEIKSSHPVTEKINISQFTGISPKSYARLFGHQFERKNSEGRLQLSDSNAMPSTHVYLDSYILYESIVVQEIEKTEGNKNG